MPEDLKLPTGWQELLVERRLTAYSLKTTKEGIPLVCKCVMIDFEHSTLDFYYLSKRLDRCDYPSQFREVEQLNKILWDFECAKICPGINNRRFDAVKGMRTGQLDAGKIWRSNKYSKHLIF